MAMIETVGNFQLHLFAHELPSGRWDPFVTILRFDDELQDFGCVLEKHLASEEPLPTHDAAIDEARRVGTALIESGNL